MKKFHLIQHTTNASNGLRILAQQQQPQEVHSVQLQEPNECEAGPAISVTTANVAGNNEVTATYQQRKSMKPAYKELFAALFRIPDKSVHERVLRAINDTSNIAEDSPYICSRCGNKPKLTNAETQTIDLLSSSNNGTSSNSPRLTDSTNATSCNNNNDSPESSRDSGNKAEMQDTEQKTASPTATVRKKRKRKVCLPQVVKKSHAQHAQYHLQPKLKKLDVKNKSEENRTPLKTLTDIGTPDVLPVLRSRSSTIGSIDKFVDLPLLTRKEFLVKTMAQEYIDAESFQEGLLPIFYNITVGDCDALQRQIYVWKYLKKEDLNDLFTDSDEDCLQLAISHNCKPELLDILLTHGLNINSRDACSNTIIHLAILNEINLESFRFLVKKLTNFKLLLELNDDGYTPLHVAVRANYYRHAEVLLDTLDMCLLERVTYSRPQTCNTDSKVDFQNYYMEACKQLETNSHSARPKLKMKLLECGDRRSGSTALFYAIENQMEHCIYFLLAHLTDPRIKNHSGQDAKSYFSEFGKVLRLDPLIDRAMENVVKILN